MIDFADTVPARTGAQTCCEHYGVACGQGRQCPQRMAAEACTELGADDGPCRPPMTRVGLLLIAVAFVSAAAGVAAFWPR